MSSSRKILWRVASAVLKCKKKDPTKKTLYLQYWWSKSPKTGKYYGLVSVRDVPVDHLQSRIVELSETYDKWSKSPHAQLYNLNDLQLALDYLFVELGRRASRAVVR